MSLIAPVNCFKLSEVTEYVVPRILCKLNSSKATGLDLLSPRFVKDGAVVTVSPLTRILNLSLKFGELPDDIKEARVTTIHKKNSKLDAGNYQPVLIPSTISNLFERIVYNQLDDYLRAHKLLYQYQSDFRSVYFADICLVNLTDYIKQEQDKGRYIGMVLLDLQNAFDSVNRRILLHKLEALELQKSAADWFQSYL